MNSKALVVIVVIALAGGFVFNNYGVPGAIVIIPFIFPLLFTAISLICAEKWIHRFASGILALTIFDIVRWVAWVNEVGSRHAVSDEQTYGIAKLTIAIHLIVFTLSFAICWLISTKPWTKASNKNAL